MLHHGLAFDYVPSAEPPPADFASRPYAAYVLSDYPATRLGDSAMLHIKSRVEQGAGLLMIGGWESYHGLGGDFHQSPLAEVLPVEMQSCDDRRNCPQPCLIEAVGDHAILAGLPWQEPPTIGGYNLLREKPGAELLLSAARFSALREGGHYHFDRTGTAPLLVVGQYGTGRTAALATDVAPHWVGGFVDWGDQRVTQAVGSGAIEVGNWYAQFFRNLVAWVGNM
jgi:uncharacterized membrane protein